MRFSRRVYFGITIATIIILFKSITLSILRRINRTFNLWDWLYRDIFQSNINSNDLELIFLIVVWLIIAIGVTLIITIFKNRILHSLIFSLLFVFYFQEFSISIISPNQISKLIEGIGISVGENLETPYLILVIFFTVVFYLFSLIFTFGKKGEEKVNISKKNKPQVEKTPESHVDFEKERKEKIRDIILETGKTINEVMQEVHDSTLRDNLQLLHSQVNSISNSYFQSNISFERAVEQLNEIKNDVETLSKEPEETTTGAQVDLETPEENDYYNILNVAPDASPEEIKLAYIRKIKKYHPDKVSGGDIGDKINAQKMCQKINRAYHALNHQAKRNAYN